MLTGTTAFVTGASQGIGQSIACTLAEYGANVAIAARSEGIYETAEMIDSVDRALPIQTDVSDEASVQEAISATVDRYGGLDCLVNNAGIAGPTAPIEEISPEEWKRTMRVNVFGMFLTTKYSVAHLRESERPRIVNISSVSGKRPLEKRTPYAASKMAVIGLTRTLAFELEDPITVNSICPAPVEGPRLEDVISKLADEQGVSHRTARERLFADKMALEEVVDPEDVAEMVAFLASENGTHITAQDINVDSGTAWY